MTNNDLLLSFYSRSFEHQLHEKFPLTANDELPVDEIKNYMLALIRIPLSTFMQYADEFYENAELNAKDIASCHNLNACTTELCQVLARHCSQGMSTTEIGEEEIFSKYLRKPHKASWMRFGSRQTKAANQMGLAFRLARRWHLSCFGYAYALPLLSPLQQKRFIARALLRHPLYASVFSKLRFETVNLDDYMKGWSDSTKGTRASGLLKLLEVVTDEMDREGLKRHDLLLPKYQARTQALSTKIVKGTYTALDKWGVGEDYVEGAIPLYTVKAACGYFVDHEVPELEGWLNVTGQGVKTNSEDYFVVYAKGDSMLPKIKDGDLCLFKWYRGENLYDDIVLTQCREYDAEYESSYTIKCFHPNEFSEDGTPTISLLPLNRKHYHPITLSAEDGVDYKTIGTFVKVLEA